MALKLTEGWLAKRKYGEPLPVRLTESSGGYSETSVRRAIDTLKPVFPQMAGAMASEMERQEREKQHTDQLSPEQRGLISALALRKVEGDGSRGARLWKFWSRFYGDEIFQAADINVTKRAEIGAANLVQHAGRQPEQDRAKREAAGGFQPEVTFTAIDLPEIAASSQVALQRFQAEGLLSQGFRVVGENAEVMAPLNADVISGNLLAMYLKPERTARMMLWHAPTFEIGDLAHGDFVPEKKIEKGKKIHIASSRDPHRKTPLVIEVGEKKVTGYEHLLGQTYGMKLSVDKPHTRKNSDIRYLPTSDNQKGMLTVLPNGRVIPWAVLPKAAASEEDVKKIAGFVTTLVEEFGRQTNGEIEHGVDAFDGNAGPLVAEVAHKQILESARRGKEGPYTVFTTGFEHTVPPGVILSILFLHADRIQQLATEGKLTAIGEGRTFQDIPTFWNELRRMNENMHMLVDIQQPPIFKSITTTDKETAQKLRYKLQY